MKNQKAGRVFFLVLISFVNLIILITLIILSSAADVDCIPDFRNTTWSDWYSISSCINGFVQQERVAVNYDANGCNNTNITIHEYQSLECTYCNVLLVNTSWSIWTNITPCMQNNTMTLIRSRIQYDRNNCGVYENQSFPQTREGVCDYCTPKIANVDLTDWINATSGCAPNNRINQSKEMLQYDSNFCNETANKRWTLNRTWTCDYCTPNLVNVSGEWRNITACRPDNHYQQVQNITQYDSNNCNEVSNRTFFNYSLLACDYCTPNLVNSSWSNYTNITRCNINDKLNQSRYFTRYDNNSCKDINGIKEVNDTRFYEYQEANCTYCHPNVTNMTLKVVNVSACFPNNTLVQRQDVIQYDNKFCGEISNQLISLNFSVACDYCTPNLKNVSISNWTSASECYLNNTLLLTRNMVEYDVNNCYSITNLPSDLWNNFTFNETKIGSCDFCTPQLVSIPIGDWINDSCKASNTRRQSQLYLEYDINNCKDINNNNEISNRTYFAYRNAFCDYCTPNMVNSTSEWKDFSCLQNNILIQERTIREYDSNNCNEINETVVNESKVIPDGCDYCTPRLVNLTIELTNMTECYTNNTYVEFINKIQYDANNCNEIENSSSNELRIGTCDFCTPNLINVSGEWVNEGVCIKNKRIIQKKQVHAIDINNCNETGDINFYEYREFDYDSCAPDVSNYTKSDLENANAECNINGALVQTKYILGYNGLSCFDSSIVKCSSNSECGINNYIENPVCQNGSVYQNYQASTCNNPGTMNSYCTNSIYIKLKQTCSSEQFCSNGQCKNLFMNIVSPVNGFKYANPITIKVTDVSSNVKKIKYSDNRKSFKTLCTSFKKGTCQKRIILKQGSHVLTIEAWDSRKKLTSQKISFEVVGNMI